MTLADRIINRVTRREPDFQIGGASDPYLNRWYVIPRNPLFNIYLHQFIRDDDDRAEHDHPWWSLSWCLRGYLFEQIDGKHSLIRPGQWRLRSARMHHRLELPKSNAFDQPLSGNTWTLFITGPRVRNWGFHCPQGWVHWQKFTGGKNGEIVGKGCAQ